MRLRIAIVIALLAGAQSAAAGEATVYAGTLGKLPVIVELTPADPDGKFAGRYAYLAKGADIPLHGVLSGKGGALHLAEEKPCSVAICKTPDGEVLDVSPISADWTLTAQSGERRLTGTWHDKASGKSLPVNLERKARRELPDNDYGPFESLDPSYLVDLGNPPVLTPEALPYDFLKMQRSFKQGVVTTIGDSAYRMDEDPRTGLAYPYVVKLGNADPAPVNTYLAQQSLQFALPAFSCLTKAYLGFGWADVGGEGTTGYEGSGTVAVEHLTPRLMGLVEAGSYYCGGAYPNNFTNHRLADARTGKALVPESLLRGWVATNADGAVVDPATAGDETKLTFGPSEALIKFVMEHRQKFDVETENGCGIDDLIRSNLAVYFTQDNLVFTFQGLPHVIFACTDDLLTVPLKDARPLLSESGAAYFAVLDR